MSDNFAKPLPSVEYLNECFTIDIINGILYWKHRPLSHFNYNIKLYNSINKRCAGKVAGSYLKNKTGGYDYRRVKLDKSTYKEHRLIFKMHYGYEPDSVDHINRISCDNRPINLRSCNQYENNENRVFKKIKKNQKELSLTKYDDMLL